MINRHNDPRVVPAVRRLLETEIDPITRRRAQQLLDGYAREHYDTVPAQAYSLLSETRGEPEFQQAFQTLQAPAEADFWEQLGQLNPLTAMTAAQTLSSAERMMLQSPVREGLTHSDWRVRRTCAALVPLVGDAVSVQAVWKALYDPKEDVRRAALQAILKSETKRAVQQTDLVETLIALTLTDRSRHVRLIAIAALGDRMPDERIAEALHQAVKKEQCPALLAHLSGALRKTGNVCGVMPGTAM